VHLPACKGRFVAVKQKQEPRIKGKDQRKKK